MLDLAGLTTSFDAFQLGPVDLTVRDEVLAVLGPSGCGKTTLLSTIAGIVTPEAGRITLDGRRLDDEPTEDRGTALVFQEGALFPHLTARENLAYAAADGVDLGELAATLEIGSVLDRRADTLSGGEQQRVALARALAAEPAALLLDEPLANLDAPIKRRLRDDLRELFAPLAIPVVYVTHDQTEASSIGDRIAVLEDGQVQQVGTPSAVFARPATPFVARFTGSSNVFRATAAADGGFAWGSYCLEVAGGGAPGFSPAAGERVWLSVRPEHVVIAEPTHGDAPDRGSNRLVGRVTGCVLEGDTYRVTVRPAGVDDRLDVTLLPPAVERLDLGAGDRLAVHLPPAAIHVIGDSGAAAVDPSGAEGAE